MRRTFIQRLVRKSPPDLWDLGVASGEVISARMSRAMAGRLTMVEARRMIVEKQLAGIRAHFALTRAFLNGEPKSAHQAIFNIYHAAVRSNRNRLCSAPSRGSWRPRVS
jgi:hypothetical protein